MAAAFVHMAVALYLAGRAVEVEPAGLPFEFEMGIELEGYAAPEVQPEPPSNPKKIQAAAPARKHAVKTGQAVAQPVLEAPDRTELEAVEEMVENTLEHAAASSEIEQEPAPEEPEAPSEPLPEAPPEAQPEPEAAVSTAASVETREGGGREDEHEPGPPPRDAATSRGIERFEARLLAHLEKNKLYPREARLRRQEGVVYVRFAMNRHGGVLSLEIEKSSGIGSLDSECLALVRRSEPLPALPSEIHGERLEIVVPVYFSLR
jgi:protein TonB